MNSTGKVLLGILAGAAAGAILGVLLAPDKGSETRRKLMQKGEDYADALKDKFDELLDGVSDKINGSEQGSTGNGKARVDEFKNDAKTAIG
jgi:gas vesicle protein